MSRIMPLFRLLTAFIPMILLVLLNGKNNLKKEYRSRQFLMPVVALIYSLAVVILLKIAITWCRQLVEFTLARLSGLESLGALGSLTGMVNGFIRNVQGRLMTASIVTLNTLLMVGFLFVKRIVISFCRALCRPGGPLYETTASWFYEPSEEDVRYVKQSTVKARRYLKALYITAVAASFIMLLISMYLYMLELLQLPFFPVLGFLVIGEVYFYINGFTASEAAISVSGEEDRSRKVFHYSSLRKILRGIFGDKLLDDGTTAHADFPGQVTAEELIERYRRDDRRVVETYGRYMDKYRMDGHALDQNYLASGLELLLGKSIHFNNPFYYDLIPYAFYAMNHSLLCHKKVLIILGRHGVEEDITNWCEVGLRSVMNVEGLWRIGVLSGKVQELDVGIITRSDVQNLELHRVNGQFFRETGYVVIIEPSKLITTAQVGLNSIIRSCRASEDNSITFCSFDKNCDGLVDALSHALMTSISEVSSTEAHGGVCSYMCWTADREYWQHRLLPNISRFLGNGTELSFAALKNNVSQTRWYGGDRFPVADMHWIAKQYYSELLSYANLPISQELMDNVFVTSQNLWDVKKAPNVYITVEDESNNLFEMKREFSTRADDQGFINIISSPYMLCDYMTENPGIFNADSKAIPYIVADYVATRRNILLRLCVQMASGTVWETDVRKELLLADIDSEEALYSTALWNALCDCFRPVGKSAESEGGREHWTEKYRESDVIFKKKKYNVETGRDENCYFIENDGFVRTVLGDMANARYIAEEEDKDSYLGTECLGQIYQKYLPGQFFTLCGKYYEMIRVTYDRRVLVRRAADHITGRPAYRQVRNYVINGETEDTQMGSRRNFGSMKVERMYADVEVETPAYWDMPAYNDFAHARLVEINGVPQRSFNNKWILKITMSDITDSVRITLTNLLNEVFRTLFAENQDMIIAATEGECLKPLTYSITTCNKESDKAIYIIEDCQYDIGLLSAVERNIDRIFQIICDYLEWNKEEIIESQEAKKEKPDYSITPEQSAIEEAEAEEEKKKKKPGLIRRIIEKIKSIFRKKPKPEPAGEEQSEDTPESEEAESPAETSEEPVNEEPVGEEPDEEEPVGEELTEEEDGEPPITEGEEEITDLEKEEEDTDE